MKKDFLCLSDWSLEELEKIFATPGGLDDQKRFIQMLLHVDAKGVFRPERAFSSHLSLIARLQGALFYDYFSFGTGEIDAMHVLYR